MTTNLIDVITYTYAGPQSGFIHAAEFHPNFTLLTVEDGEFDYGFNNHEGRATFGDLVFSPSHTILKRKSLKDKITFHFFQFHSNIGSDHPFLEIPIGKVTVSDVNRLSSTFANLRKIWRGYRDVAKINYFANHLLTDLLYMCQFEKQNTMERKKNTDPLMQQAIGHIHRHLFDQVQLKDISKLLSIKPSELTRRFRLSYHVTPVQYITERRLEEVKRQLLETNETLEAIADRCGFDNASYLSRVFRAKIGVSPSYFRKKHRI